MFHTKHVNKSPLYQVYEYLATVSSLVKHLSYSNHRKGKILRNTIYKNKHRRMLRVLSDIHEYRLVKHTHALFKHQKEKISKHEIKE